MKNIKNNFIDSIGNTPLIKLKAASEITGCNIYGKAEYLNPGGSVKDRAALALIKDAQEKKLISEGGIVVEGTAGNTGKDSWSLIEKAPSICASAKFLVILLEPIPSVIDPPSAFNSPFTIWLYKADPVGSDRYILMSLFFSFKNLLTPPIVPPVPDAHTNPSILPSVCSQISGPVVS